MLTSMQQTMSMTFNDYNASPESKDTKFWDFSLAPDARPLFGGPNALLSLKKVNTTKNVSSNQFAKDFTISSEVEKSLGSGFGFKMDGSNTKNRTKSATPPPSKKKVNNNSNSNNNNAEAKENSQHRKNSFESNLTLVSSTTTSSSSLLNGKDTKK